MKQLVLWCTLAVVGLGAGAALYSQGRNGKGTPMAGSVAFRVLLGTGDKVATPWDGSVAVAPGSVDSIQIWRPHGSDSTDSKTSWKASSDQSFTPVGRAFAGMTSPILENGVIVAVTVPDDNAKVTVTTNHGSFSFQPKEIPFGVKKTFVDGGATVDRVPNTVKLTNSREDEDFPAVADSGDDVYATYVQFVRGDRSVARWNNMGGEGRPASFDFVSRPTGGDQVFLITYSKSKKTWSAPVAVSSAKQDIMRAAVAVDGNKRVWVFYAANRNGNFDIYAKSRSGSAGFSSEQRLTSDAGSDLNPVATTDSSGRVWVAWQGFRNNNLEVLAAAQNGDKFTAESVVSFSKASDWDPAIAAAGNGEVAISWDTYDKGDYDVYFRRVKFGDGIKMEEPVPVAATTAFEARSSLAYDKRNRLWVAYEVSGSKWGKDTGVYDKEGIPLYRDHSVQVKCFDGAQAFEAPGDNLAAVLPKAAVNVPPGLAGKTGKKKKQAPVDEHETAGPGAMSLNSMPRLAVDSSGVMYIAFRTRTSPGRTSIGSEWMEQLIYFDGAKWVGPVVIPNTTEWIDNRPAMAALEPGHLMMLVSTDNRNTQILRAPAKGGRRVDTGPPDAVNADIYAAEMRVPVPDRSPNLKPAAAAKVAAPEAEIGPERQQVEKARGYRAAVGGEQLSMLRGEFHRHTDVSVDGQGDGPLIDAYRYMIDAASMDWGGCCDHDNGTNEYAWWLQQKLTDAYKLGDRYIAMFAYERSVSYPEGHRNVVFSKRGIRPLPRLPKMEADSAGHAPDTAMLYDYLKKYNGIVASHTSGTDMGTDWRDNDPKVEPVVEIYQGCRQNYEMPGAPRCNKEEDSIGGWRPLGFVSLALKKGYRLAFQASSDHGSTHISYCNLWVTKRTREGVLEAFQKRRVYGATDNIVAEVRSGTHFMGEEFTTSTPPAISVKLTGTAAFAKVHIVKDGEYVYSTEPKTQMVDFTWKDTAPVKGKTSYYYVRGEQTDGELVWASPMWITYQ